jgi:uroporphyrinogen-III synthase
VISQATSHNAVANGRTVVITRPAGTASALARQVRATGDTPLLIPGLSLRAADHADDARAQWRDAMRDDLLAFTSPAAVRYAFALAPLKTKATVLAVGQGTASALRRHGIDAQAPTAQQNSEGLLELAPLQLLHGRRVALIGASGGRALLRDTLLARGATLREVHVYRRVAPRLYRRHIDAVMRLTGDARVLLSSAEALQNLSDALPPAAWQKLQAAIAVVSSPRLAEIARAAGFVRVRVAASASAADLLIAAA